MAKATKTSLKTRVVQSKDLPATQGMLGLVRTELKSDIRGLRSEMNAQFKRVDARFSQVDSKFSQVDAKLETVLSAVHQVASDVARIGTLVEERNSRNQVVLEGLSGLFHRQERVESRMTETENLVQSITTRTRS